MSSTKSIELPRAKNYLIPVPSSEVEVSENVEIREKFIARQPT
jgi:hypothetical protein